MRKTEYSTLKLLLLILLTIIFACKNDDKNENEIAQISYGTSFGMCFGYCISTLKVYPEKVTFIRAGRNDEVQTITITDTYTGWDGLFSEADTMKIFGLPEVLGCPDCADGGAEWIEIVSQSGKKHKVTFEYMNEPEEIEDLIILLREKAEELRLRTEE
jgi:hypothetical protein